MICHQSFGFFKKLFSIFTFFPECWWRECSGSDGSSAGSGSDGGSPGSIMEVKTTQDVSGKYSSLIGWNKSILISDWLTVLPEDVQQQVQSETGIFHYNKDDISMMIMFQHILNMHTVGKELQCEICDKKVKNKWYLRRHHVTHHGAPLKKWSLQHQTSIKSSSKDWIPSLTSYQCNTPWQVQSKWKKYLSHLWFKATYFMIVHCPTNIHLLHRHMLLTFIAFLMEWSQSLRDFYIRATEHNCSM